MVTVGTVIVLALYALLDTIISLLFNGAMWIARSIMDSSITLFASGQNIINTFVSLLPFGEGENSVNVGSIIDGISYGIIILVIVIGVLKSMLSPFTGDETDNAFTILIRAITAIVLKHLIFGFSGNFLDWSFDGLLGVFGKWFGLILSKVGAFNYENFTDINAWTINAAAYIGALILMATLLGCVLGAAISYIERILSFALTIIIGPVAISLYAYRDTMHIARQWILSIFTQFGAILLNLLLWGAFINEINSLEGLWVSADDVGNLIFKLAIAVSILSLIKNCEKILNSIGLHTLLNQDSARAITGGVAALGSGVLLALRSAPSAKAMVERGMHGKNPAQGGNSAKGFATPFTGNSLYDKNGNLNSKGEGNRFSNAARGLLARSIGNFDAPLFGPNSTRAAQNRQQEAQNILSSMVGKEIEMAKGKNAFDANGNAKTAAGMKIGDGIAFKDGQKESFYSGAKLANMAISGHENGYGNGFRFSESLESGGTQNEGFTIGTTIASNGNEVAGIIGQGTFMGNDGLEKNLGKCFVPTMGGGEENILGIGQEVCVGYDEEGNCKNMFVTDAVRIGDDGAYAYRLGTPIIPREVIIANEHPINVEVSNTEPISFSISEMDNLFKDESLPMDMAEVAEYGENNIKEADIFDPEGCSLEDD